MKLILSIGLFIFFALSLFACNPSGVDQTDTLNSAFKGKFLIGTALNTDQITGTDTASIKVIIEQFNTITAENCMKSESIQPQEREFDFDLADQFVEFGESHNMFIVGHALIWHEQARKWFFVDENGNDVSRDTLINRMKNHISTLVSRYKGRVNGWDVVNEAIMDDGSWRNNKFYEIIGEDYVRLAFEMAHDADPNAELYYNDYSMFHEGRRNGVVKMIKSLQDQGIKVDGIGMQAHYGLDFPDLKELEKSIIEFSKLGVQVVITELDISVLPSPDYNLGADVSASFEYQQKMNPYTEVLPDSVNTAFENRYIDLFNLFLKHQNIISRVTLWGVNDAQSWKNNWPIHGRTDYPLLFDRNNNAKPIVYKIIKNALKN